MVIYGIKNTPLASAPAEHACPQCKSEETLTVNVYARYVHIFWIPTIPIGRTGLSHCSNCQQILKVKEMPPAIRQVYNTTFAQTKIPYWQLSGLFIIGVLITWASLQSEADKKKELRYIESPLAGDVYRIKTEDKNFSTIKVAEVDGDTLWVQYNNYAFTTRKGAEEIEVDSNYTAESYGVLHEEIKGDYKSGKIYEIERKN